MFKKSNYEERKISSLHMGGMLAIITTYFMIFFFLLLNQTRQFPKLNVTEFKVCFRDISISRTSLTFCVLSSFFIRWHELTPSAIISDAYSSLFATL